MNKILCIDEAKIIAKDQKERVRKNIFQLYAKIKKVDEKIKDLNEKERNTIIESLKEKIKNLLIKYNRQEIKRFNKIKNYLTSELIANKNLINEYKYSIDEFRKDYKAEDIDVSKVEQQISTLEEKIEEIKQNIYSERNKTNGEKSAISEYAKKLNEYESNLYEYKAIKVISLLGKSTPEAKIHQYESAIKKVRNEFRIETAIDFLEELEIVLTVDEEPIIEEKTSKLKKAKDKINSIKNSTLIQAIATSPTIQEGKEIAYTIEGVCNKIVKNLPGLQAILDVEIELEDKLKDNIFDLIYLVKEDDLAVDVTTYAKTDSETYTKKTLGKKNYDNHNTLVKKINTGEVHEELFNKINMPCILTKSVTQIFTQRKKDKFGYSIQKTQSDVEKMIDKQNSKSSKKDPITNSQENELT